MRSRKRWPSALKEWVRLAAHFVPLAVAIIQLFKP